MLSSCVAVCSSLLLFDIFIRLFSGSSFCSQISKFDGWNLLAWATRLCLDYGFWYLNFWSSQLYILLAARMLLEINFTKETRGKRERQLSSLFIAGVTPHSCYLEALSEALVQPMAELAQPNHIFFFYLQTCVKCKWRLCSRKFVFIVAAADLSAIQQRIEFVSLWFFLPLPKWITPISSKTKLVSISLSNMLNKHSKRHTGALGL